MPVPPRAAGVRRPDRGRRGAGHGHVHPGDVRPAAHGPGGATPRWRRGSSRRRPTCPCRPTSAAGSTRWACSPRPTSPTSWARAALLRWRQGPTGHHIELGISEMNLFLMLGQLGLAARAARRDAPARSAPSTTRSCAEASTRSIYGTYSASRFVVVGTPSGVTLAPEGGAHQCTITAVHRRRAARRDVRRAGLRHGARLAAVRRRCDRLADPDGESMYLRLSTRPDRPGAVRCRARTGSATSSCGRRAGRRLPPGRGALGRLVRR